MHIDKKMMHRIFLLIAGAIVFAWLVLDTARATALFQGIWELFAPFVIGAGIAFIFNVPMRSIENQLEGVHKQSVRRTISMLLTIFALILGFFAFKLYNEQIIKTGGGKVDNSVTYVTKTRIKASRGDLLDTNGNVLVDCDHQMNDADAKLIDKTLRAAAADANGNVETDYEVHND